jgi:Spy/CpxP family protein refolding chaperone
MKNIIMIVLSLSFVAQASISGHHKKCGGLDLSTDQKEAIHSIKKAEKEVLKRLIPIVKTSAKNFKAVLNDASSTKDEASTAKKFLKHAAASVKKLKSVTKMTILFDILEGEQRVTLLKCKKNRRHRRHKRGHGHAR